MRLLPFLDSEGRLQDGTEVGARVHALCEKIPREAETTKGVLLVVLRRTCALVEQDNGKKLAMRAFLNAGGLRPLGTWLERADKHRSDDFVRLLLDALSDLPVTARLVKASDVGKIVKRLKKDRKESGDEGMDAAYKGLMQNWYEKANKGRRRGGAEAGGARGPGEKSDGEEEAKKRSSSRRTSSRPRCTRRSVPRCPTRPWTEVGPRASRRGGRVDWVAVWRPCSSLTKVMLFDDDGQPITSRPIDPELAEATSEAYDACQVGRRQRPGDRFLL